MREILPRTITGIGTIVKIVDDNGATWEIEEILSGTWAGTSDVYVPKARVYGSNLTDVRAKIDSYAYSHNIGTIFNSLNAYIDKNNGIWFRKNLWKDYLGKFPPELPPSGTPHWMADSTYYKPYTMVFGENEFELKDAIDGFVKSYKGVPPAKDLSPPDVISEIPPVIIKAEPIPGLIPTPPVPSAPVMAQASSGAGLGSAALGSLAAVSGILWWRSR